MPRSTVGNNALKTNAKCKNWKKLGYKSEKDCSSYGKKKKKTAIEYQLEKTMDKQTGKDLQKKYGA
jgi:hypothetical protein